jgi:pentatricopeptide repeat protein
MYYTIYCYVQLKEYENAKKLYEKMERDFYKNPWTEKAKELIK